MSQDITTMLRHANHGKTFHIDQFTGRRVNKWSMKAQQSWTIPSRWKPFQEMVQWKFAERRGHSNGPATEAAVAHFHKDGESAGYESWNDYYPIFILRAFQYHIDPEKNKVE
eukprot:6826958-Pyramimonas_sp.AAC.1